MQIFVCEFVTGGGLKGEALSPSLAAEGGLMRDSLIADIEALGGFDVVTTHDSRLPPPPQGDSRPIDAADDVTALWTDLAARADACLVIAPETGGELRRLVGHLRAHGGNVMAPDDDTLRICTSKLATAQCLAGAGLPMTPTFRIADLPPELDGPYVVKPDDGAGSADVRLCDRAALPDVPETHVVQPFVEGRARSLSLLCQNGTAQLLSVNHQHVQLTDGRLSFHGVTVGAEPPTDDLAALCEGIFAALPGLQGFVGVDYVASARGPLLIEVNPRLTTSYAGFRQALGVNPLSFLTAFGGTLTSRSLPSPTPIEVLV